jgi:hypothetical protein
VNIVDFLVVFVGAVFDFLIGFAYGAATVILNGMNAGRSGRAWGRWAWVSFWAGFAGHIVL